MDKRKPNYLLVKQKSVQFIISFIIFIAGWVIGMRISPQVGAVLIIIACALFTYLIVSILPIKWARTVFRIGLPLLVLVLLPVFLWNSIVGLATPPIRELSNAYIHETINSNGTLLEFGVRRYATDLDVTVVTKDGYTSVEDWWDSPGLTDRSSNASCGICTVRSVDEYGRQVLAKPIIISRDISSPTFEFKIHFTLQVTPDRSYYVRFNATEAVIIQSVRFGSVTEIGK
jgi:hypothetical protein